MEIIWADFYKRAARDKKVPVFLDTKPSPAVEPIEDFIGADFGPKPAEAILHGKNLLGLSIHALGDPWLRKELAATIEPSVYGQYLPTYHLDLLKPLPTLARTRDHEAAHAFARNINPLALRLIQGRMGPLVKLTQDSPEFIELAQSYRCAQEGFAVWVSSNTHDHINPSIERTPELEVQFQNFSRGVASLRDIGYLAPNQKWILLLPKP